MGCSGRGEEEAVRDAVTSPPLPWADLPLAILCQLLTSFLLDEISERGDPDSEGGPWAGGIGKMKGWERMGAQGLGWKGWVQVKSHEEDGEGWHCLCQPQPSCFSPVAPVIFFFVLEKFVLYLY